MFLPSVHHMMPKIRLFACPLVLLATTSCSVFARPTQAVSQATPTTPLITETFTPTPVPSDTPLPSATITPTQAPPSSTPTQTQSPTPAYTPIPISTQLRIFENVWTIVNDTYVYPDFNGLDWNAIHQEYKEKISAGLSNDQFYQAIRELIYKLGDDHSRFLSPQENAEQEAEFQGNLNYVGIGVLVTSVPEHQHAVILTVFPNSPAEAAGLRTRDSIISVDGTPILDENGFLRDIVRGPEGTTIKLVVQTPGQPQREIDVTRHKITGEVPVEHTVITTAAGKRIGYILLVTFEDSTVDENVASAMREMTADAPLDGLILDNRMNGGGSSTVVEPVLSYYTGGTVGYFIKQDEKRPLQIQLDDIYGSSTVPLVILIGTGTVSFGEIFAGVLQDVGRAYLIGETTNGNVEILWGYDLDDGSRLWLASETFRPLNHPEQNWDKTGIVPDLSVAGDFDEYLLENDPAVLAAIQHLSGE